MAIQKFTEDVEKYLKWASDTDGTTQQDYQEFVRNMYNLAGNLIDGLRLWQPSTIYEQGEIVVSPSMNPNTWARVTTAGVTGSVEPSSWGASGGTVSDGTVTYAVVPRTLDFATDAELTAGTVSNKIVSPKTLKTIMDTRLSPKLNTADLTPSMLWDVLHSKGVNFKPSNVTNAGWTALGTFISYYTSKVLDNQPTQYGQLINICADKSSEATQLWLDQSSGKLAYRGGNGSIVMNDTAFTYVASATDLANAKSELKSSISTVSAKAGVVAGDVSNANSWWVKLGGTIPLIIQGGLCRNNTVTYPVAFTKALLTINITQLVDSTANYYGYDGRVRTVTGLTKFLPYTDAGNAYWVAIGY